MHEERRGERRLGTPARWSPWWRCSCVGRVGSRHAWGWRLARLASAMTRPHSAPGHENGCAYTVIHAHKDLHRTQQSTAGAYARVLVTPAHAKYWCFTHSLTPSPSPSLSLAFSHPLSPEKEKERERRREEEKGAKGDCKKEKKEKKTK